MAVFMQEKLKTWDLLIPWIRKPSRLNLVQKDFWRLMVFSSLWKAWESGLQWQWQELMGTLTSKERRWAAWSTEYEHTGSTGTLWRLDFLLFSMACKWPDCFPVITTAVTTTARAQVHFRCSGIFSCIQSHILWSINISTSGRKPRYVYCSALSVLCIMYT